MNHHNTLPHRLRGSNRFSWANPFLTMLLLAFGGVNAATAETPHPNAPANLLQTREIRQFKGLAYPAAAVAFSPDGKQILGGCEDGTLHLWEAQTGREIRSWQDHRDGPTQILFLPSGKQAVTHNDSSLRLWDLETGKELRRFANDSSAAAITPDGKRILWSTRRRLYVADIQTGKEILALDDALRNLILAVSFSGDGRHIASFAFDPHDWNLPYAAITLWDAQAGKRMVDIDSTNDVPVCLAFSADGKQVFDACKNLLRIHDVATGKELSRVSWWDTYRDFTPTAFSPDFSRIIAVTGVTIPYVGPPVGVDETIVLELSSGVAVARLTGIRVGAVAWSPDGKTFLGSIRDDTAIHLYEAFAR